MTFGLNMKFKAISRTFVDSRNIQNAVDRSARRGLNRFGGFARTVIRRSIRRGGTRPKTLSQLGPGVQKLIATTDRDRVDLKPWPRQGSTPGNPPKSRDGRLRNQIYYVVAPNNRSVVIGPQIFDGKDVPGTIEFGGLQTDAPAEWVAIWSGGKKRIRLARNRGRRVRMEARPYVAPGYDAAIDKLVPDIWTL